jgi:hypothetical protein
MSKEFVVDAEGNQLDYFAFSVTEKVGLPKYSSIDIFASIGRYVPNTDEARQEVIDLVESIAARERAVVLESVGIVAEEVGYS